jgi:hypothetical protein
MAGSFACMCGVVTAEGISMQRAGVSGGCSRLTGALRFGGKDSGVCSLG